MAKALLLPLILATFAAVVALSACSDGAPEVRPGPAPRTTETPVFPPLEGPERTFQAQGRTNYREHPDFQLPDPEDLPEPSGDQDGLEFHPPEKPECPDDWEVLSRPPEGFEICHPEEWAIDGHGLVTLGVDDRWYSVGFYLFGEDDRRERAHVSVYVTQPYSEPALFVKDCEQAYHVTLDGLPASLCPDFLGEFPEAKIIAYHVRRDDHDYFIQVVPLLEYDEEEGGYLDTWPKDIEETGIRIAQSVHFIEIIGQ
jgi:hypothetical protein